MTKPSQTAMLARLLASAFGAVCAVASIPARANCARPSDYEVEVVNDTVLVCPHNFEGRECPDPHGMIRESATLDVVRLPDRCAINSSGVSCYVDECVHAGIYRYGFARPYECCEYCCGTMTNVRAEIGADHLNGCDDTDGGGSSDDDAGILASPPWSRMGDEVCGYSGGTSGGGGRGGAGGTSGVGGQQPIGGSVPIEDGGMVDGSLEDAGLDAATADGGHGSESNDDSGCGCSILGAGNARHTVFVVDAIVAATGLALLGRKRRKSGGS